MKKPYLKKIKKIAGLNVFMVDGQYVRNEIDVEFTNFGQHYRFKFIPKKELWIDREQMPGEEKYFIEHLLIERRLMKKGFSYERAIMLADRHEKEERAKKKISKIVTTDISKQNIYQSEWKKYSDDSLKIKIVKGEIVRGLLYIDFTQGGHGFVYRFVPKNEIWLDDDLVPSERPFVLLHELRERRLMIAGSDYDHAHALASRLEYWARHWPLFVGLLINLELRLNRRACFEKKKRKK